MKKLMIAVALFAVLGNYSRIAMAENGGQEKLAFSFDSEKVIESHYYDGGHSGVARYYITYETPIGTQTLEVTKSAFRMIEYYTANGQELKGDLECLVSVNPIFDLRTENFEDYR